MLRFDVIVVGGGHAGVEAALAGARMGQQVLLLTHNLETIGQMSCNPAIGGIGKGHLVKEIDALDGFMAKAADRAGIHFRTLNSSKGPAVRATRAQSDRCLYKAAVQNAVDQEENIKVFQQGVADLLIDNNQIRGVVTEIGVKIFAKAVVLTVGTFLGGKLHIGDKKTQGGRAGDPPALALSERLRALPFTVGRLKTGTPPRLDAKTIDFSQLQEQPGDSPRPVFSWMHNSQVHPEQRLCHIAATNEKTHDIIRGALDRSPLYQGQIEGIGPRYCPSIEDKIHRFADRNSHQIFLEPEGLHSCEIYPNGVSTSLPFDVQQDFIHSIKGLENAFITRAGYAIEYDYMDPRGLKSSLETKPIAGLFFAGQINGTTGYEEAAAQGIIAGCNASLWVQEKEPFYLQRSEAYIGVLINDLITQGATEPYRMFTSRSEYRLLLREDNADLRLTERGYHIGLVREPRYRQLMEKKESIARETSRLQDIWVRQESMIAKEISEKLQTPIRRDMRLIELFVRPEVNYQHLSQITSLKLEKASPEVMEQIEINAKYQGYIEQQTAEIKKLQKYQNTEVPNNFPYDKITGLSHEVREKLQKHQPETLGDASRISGVTPAAISLLLVFLKKFKMEQKESREIQESLLAERSLDPAVKPRDDGKVGRAVKESREIQESLLAERSLDPAVKPRDDGKVGRDVNQKSQDLNTTDESF